MLNLDLKEFKLIKSLSWADTFDIWRRNEANDPRWIEHYQSRGFDSWEEWRTTYTDPLRCSEKNWYLYEILDPMHSIPNFCGGPFRGWVERYYRGEELPTFRKIIEHPGIQSHEGINKLIENFPKETSIIGLSMRRGIVILEGMHRCCAISLAAERSQELKTSVLIAMAKFSGKLPILGRAAS